MPVPPSAPVSQAASLVPEEAAPPEMPEVKPEAVQMEEVPKSDNPVIKTEGEGSKIALKPMGAGIEVVAIRPGFFKNRRMVAGDVFNVAAMEKVGDWMKCTNPELEKEHQAMMRKKKAGK